MWVLTVKGKAFPVQAGRGVRVEAARVSRQSPLRTGRLYPPGNIPGTRFC
jgi:hypothetical protein